MSWRCPVCGSLTGTPRFRSTTGGQSPPAATSFRPSSEHFGETIAELVTCGACGHVSVATPPAETDVLTAYEEAADEVSLREERGQVETARRFLVRIEREIPPGDVVDLGCWTGSFLVAARERGWTTIGIEPSEWAVRRARQRGLDVRPGNLFGHGLPADSVDLVVLCDVLEHVIQPRAAAEAIYSLLRPGGAAFITVPDAGSRTARLLGRRWWSILPMHLQYFSRGSLRQLLQEVGFEVRWMRTHPKAFSARYYAERLGGYSTRLGEGATSMVERSGLADRLVAPDFRDRVAVLASRPLP